MRHALVERRKRHVLWWVAAAVIVALVATGGWLWSRAQQTVDAATQGQGGSAMDIFVAKPLNGESTGRVNILLAGNSFDEQGHDGAALTDSIMVASMSLTTHRITLVSIPRDLWVNYDGKHMKINAVYPVAATGSAGASVLGDYDAGMTALGKVVGDVTGLQIDEYALVGYRALQELVDAVGGVDVVINATDPRGIYDPAAGVKLANGPQHLDGLTALRLSRARNDKQVAGNEGSYGVADSDFGRTRNQRMILSALLDKVRTTPALANPATVLAIFDAISASVRTDLSVGQVRRVFDLSTGSSGGLASITIKGDDKTMLILDNSKPESDAAKDSLVPAAGVFDYTAIRRYIAQAAGS